MNTRSHSIKGSAFGRGLAQCRWLFVALSLLLVLLTPATAAAALSVRIQGTTNVTFPDANPDTNPTVRAPGVIQWRVSADRNSVPWTLTILADDDLRSGAASIPAGAVSWVGIPGWRVNNGRLSTVTPAVLATGNQVGNRGGNNRGLLRFYMDNSWDYDVGTYSTTVSITICSP